MHNDLEAKARIKINKLLEEAGWRFFDSPEGKANIHLESHVKLEDQWDELHNAKRGFIDFLLLDDHSKPLVVLEAKSEKIEPLMAKEQARSYAISQKVKFVILSNGNVHYLWNIEEGNPSRISTFPTPQSLQSLREFTPNPQRLIDEEVGEDYVAKTQMPNYADFPEYHIEEKRANFIKSNNLRFLRYYQVNAVKSIQEKVKEGKKRFLLEMATGTGKTLTSAAIAKLFYKTGNARRILFLVDRLELETQAKNDFDQYLKNDITTVIYKNNRADWMKAEVVVTTIQSLLFNNKYLTYFSPTDFDLIISDESHRLLGGGSSRALFEYFLGYKLGLTATPKDYLKHIDTDNYDDPREYEQRVLLDTYATFGCESGNPTFRYTLTDGAKDGILVQPTVIDARTEVTTKLLSDEGYGVLVTQMNTEGEEISEEVKYKQGNFERKFFSDETNRVFVQTFLDNGLLDPISGEFGKSLIFAVSQNHASKLVNFFNEYSQIKWQGKYKNSDFAVQVTSRVSNSQQFTVDFSNDKLLGKSMWTADDEILCEYKSSRARVCVTVGMMTTGWDCPNILNLGLMRPIFSPTEFIQIKGRGTRIHNFEFKYKENGEEEVISSKKETFKLFDFFAVCEYFEEKYNYDQVLKMPEPYDRPSSSSPPPPKLKKDGFEYTENDFVTSFNESKIGTDGMKVDRMFFTQFEETIVQDNEIATAVSDGNFATAIDLTNEKYLNTSLGTFTIEKLRKSLKIDRKISIREILEQIFLGHTIKGKEELMTEEFEKFILTVDDGDLTDIDALRYYFFAYISDPQLRNIIDNKDFTELNNNPSFGVQEYSRVADSMREKIPHYIKTYIHLDKFQAA